MYIANLPEKVMNRLQRTGTHPVARFSLYRSVRMNLKMIAVAVAVLGLAVMGILGRLALPEAMWLAVWGIGLIAARASVRSVPVQALEIARVEPTREFAKNPAAMLEA